tara:strand:+ start:351 stop:701 length:351 start_codon:yes stop_codon:yes gene_type:complete
MPWKYNGQILSSGVGFKYTDGRTSPKNWYTIWDDNYKKNQGLTWEDPTSPSLTDAQKLSQLRLMRNSKLQESDWRASSDLTMSNEWKTYRQALRDITKSYQSLDAVGFTWPTEPSS